VCVCLDEECFWLVRLVQCVCVCVWGGGSFGWCVHSARVCWSVLYSVCGSVGVLYSVCGSVGVSCTVRVGLLFGVFCTVCVGLLVCLVQCVCVSVGVSFTVRVVLLVGVSCTLRGSFGVYCAVCGSTGARES